MQKNSYLDKVAEKIYEVLRVKNLLRTERIQSELHALYGGNGVEIARLLREYYTELIKKTIFLSICIGMICIVIIAMNRLAQTEEIHLERMGYGEDSTEYELQAEAAKQRTKLQIEVPSVRYTPEELEQQFEQGIQYLESKMLGENKDREHIVTDLNLEADIPDSGITVRWSSEDYDVLEENGEVHNQELQEAVEATLHLELEYEEEMREEVYPLLIYPAELTEQEQIEQELLRKLTEQIGQQEYEQVIVLPTEIDGYQLGLPSQTGRVLAVTFTGGVLVILLLWVRKREDLYRRRKKRKEALLMEYPYFVNQLQLYLGAGSTVPGALERIIRRYESEKRTNQILYQELMIVQNEIRAGITQEEAYIRFGKRAGLAPYLKLTSMLARQIRTGGERINQQLEEEVRTAFSLRKEQAKRLGEEAGTKLLFPMILLMIISMVMIMLPALKDFIL